MNRYGPCMCGATDCPSCGPAQGYEVVHVYNRRTGQYDWVNPEECDEEAAKDYDLEKDD